MEENVCIAMNNDLVIEMKPEIDVETQSFTEVSGIAYNKNDLENAITFRSGGGGGGSSPVIVTWDAEESCYKVNVSYNDLLAKITNGEIPWFYWYEENEEQGYASYYSGVIEYIGYYSEGSGEETEIKYSVCMVISGSQVYFGADDPDAILTVEQ